jgi:signal transduction histidine kinase
MPGSDRVTQMPKPPLSSRMTPGQWAVVDIAVAVAAMLVMTFGLRLRSLHTDIPTPGMAAATVAASLPVAVRRVWPLPVLAVVTTAIAVLTATGSAPLTTDLILGMASYTVAVRLRRPVAVAALVAVETAIGAGLLTAAATVHAQNVMLHSMLAAAAMWFVGYGVRERRTYQARLAEQAAQQRRAEAERDRHALQQERLLIARELHDVLAHTLSVVTVQAGVGRRVGAARPAEALRALAAVEEASRGALDELRRVLSLLRGDDEAGPAGAGSSLEPAPGLGDLDGLVAMVRAAGTPVHLDVTGQRAAVPPAAALTSYRIVQEALTNVVRHAPGARATVAMRISAAGVRIRVTDTGHQPGSAGLAGSAASVGAAGAAAGEGHHGISGMRERAAVFGGTLDAAPLPGGGFQVAAFLPVQVPPAVPGLAPVVAAGRVA